MTSLSLKINVTKMGSVKTMVFPGAMTIQEVCKEICDKLGEKSVGKGSDYSLFYPDQGKWLEPDRTLDSYDLKTGDLVEYKEKLGTLRIKLEGQVRSFQVKLDWIVVEIVASICEQLGITNDDAYSLATDQLIKAERRMTWLIPFQTLLEQGVPEDEVILLRKKFYFLSDPSFDRNDPFQLQHLFSRCKEAIVTGTQPCSQEEACQLAALQVQVEFGHKHEQLNLPAFLPPEYVGFPEIRQKIFLEHRKIQGMTAEAAKFDFIQRCRAFKTYGVIIFLIKEKVPKKNKMVKVLLGVTKVEVTRFDAESKEVLKVWPLASLRRWAASPNSLTLDFGDHADSYYSVQTTEGDSMSRLIAAYIDIMLKKKAEEKKLKEEAAPVMPPKASEQTPKARVNTDVASQENKNEMELLRKQMQLQALELEKLTMMMKKSQERPLSPGEPEFIRIQNALKSKLGLPGEEREPATITADNRIEELEKRIALLAARKKEKAEKNVQPMASPENIDAQSSTPSPAALPSSPKKYPIGEADQESGSNEVLPKFRVRYPYEKRSANEISIPEGAIPEIVAKTETGWWCARYQGEMGWFPSSFLEELPMENEDIDPQEVAAAAQEIRYACEKLQDPNSNQQQILAAASAIAKNNAALYNACKAASAKTTNPVAKKLFVKFCKYAAAHTAQLVSNIKPLATSPSDENRLKCTEPSKLLLGAVENLEAFVAARNNGLKTCLQGIDQLEEIVNSLTSAMSSAQAGQLILNDSSDKFIDYKEAILLSARDLLNDAKSLAQGAFTNQDELGSASTQSVKTMAKLSDQIKSSATSLASGNRQGQERILSCGITVAQRLQTHIHASMHALCNVADEMNSLSESAKGIVASISELRGVIETAAGLHGPADPKKKEGEGESVREEKGKATSEIIDTTNVATVTPAPIQPGEAPSSTASVMVSVGLLSLNQISATTLLVQDLLTRVNTNERELKVSDRKLDKKTNEAKEKMDRQLQEKLAEMKKDSDQQSNFMMEQMKKMREEMTKAQDAGSKKEMEERLKQLEVGHKALKKDFDEREEILREQQHITKNESHLGFYRAIQNKLQQVFLGCNVVATEAKSTSTSDHKLEVAENWVPLPGNNLLGDFTGDAGTEGGIITRVAMKELDHLTEFVGRKLALMYGEQLDFIGAESAWLLGECAAKEIIAFLWTNKLVTPEEVREEGTSYVEAVGMQLIGAVSAVESEEESGKNKEKKIKEKVSGESWKFNTKVMTSTHEEWTSDGIFHRAGILVEKDDGKKLWYSGGPTSPERYGYRRGFEEEVKRDLRMKQSRERISSQVKEAPAFKESKAMTTQMKDVTANMHRRDDEMEFVKSQLKFLRSKVERQDQERGAAPTEKSKPNFQKMKTADVVEWLKAEEHDEDLISLAEENRWNGSMLFGLYSTRENPEAYRNDCADLGVTDRGLQLQLKGILRVLFKGE